MSTIINADTSDGLKFTSDTSGEIKLQSAGTDIATVNSSGITLATGKDLTLSSTALDASASGIYLGGTASANLLDDYEEGTWTPTLVARIGSSPTVTYTNQIGLYRKIGSLVFIDIRLVISAYTGNGASQVAIGGLPFTKSILSSETGGVTFGYANGASVFTTPAGFIREGATLISLFDQPSGSSYLVDADFAASGTQGFFVTACYTTDS